MTASNLLVWHVVVVRNSEWLRRQLTPRGGSLRTLDTEIFPMVSTILFTGLVAVAIPHIGRCLRGRWLAATYGGSAAWCIVAARLAGQRHGSPNSKLVIVAIGLLVVWSVVATWVWTREPS